MRSRTRTLVGAGAFAIAMSACADKPTMPVIEDDATTVVLSADVLSLLPTGTTDLDIWIGYMRTDNSRVALRELSVHLADVTPPISIDVDPTPCLDDPQHRGSAATCDLHVALVARSAQGTQLDSAGVNTTVGTGTEQTVNFDLPDLATIGVDDTTRVTPPSELSGGSISFQSSDTSIALIGSDGLVAARNVGRVAIRMSNGTASATVRIRIAPRVSRALAVGDLFACALNVNGEAWCWGANASAQLGDGTIASRPTPARVGGSLVFREVIAAGPRACGISVAFRFYCWGQDPLRTYSPTVAPTFITSAERLELGAITTDYACALTVTRRAFCFGLNRFGGFGRGDTVSSAVPVAVTGGLTFSTLGVNLGSTCGLVGSDAYCWGSNSLRTLGNGSTASSFVPGPVVGGHAFASLWTGGGLNCGITTGGSTLCWGFSSAGAIGTGSTATVIATTPTAMTGSVAFRQLALSTSNSVFQSSCGLDAGGIAYCWGANTKGQLGTTATLPASCNLAAQTFPCTGTPTPVTTSERFLTLQIGAENACGITTTFAVRCWGSNDTGQLGDGTTTNRSTPTALSVEIRLR